MMHIGYMSNNNNNKQVIIDAVNEQMADVAPHGLNIVYECPDSPQLSDYYLGVDFDSDGNVSLVSLYEYMPHHTGHPQFDYFAKVTGATDEGIEAVAERIAKLASTGANDLDTWCRSEGWPAVLDAPGRLYEVVWSDQGLLEELREMGYDALEWLESEFPRSLVDELKQCAHIGERGLIWLYNSWD